MMLVMAEGVRRDPPVERQEEVLVLKSCTGRDI